jgi:hypothetical protein
VISTTRSLDREAQEAIELRVVAHDLGEPPLSATCLVSIAVDDVNDNEPVFLKQVYNATLPEHAPVGHCFLQVSTSGLRIKGRPGKGWRRCKFRKDFFCVYDVDSYTRAQKAEDMGSGFCSAGR